jgi:hypothetical protein
LVSRVNGVAAPIGSPVLASNSIDQRSEVCSIRLARSRPPAVVVRCLIGVRSRGCGADVARPVEGEMSTEKRKSSDWLLPE